MTQKTTLTTYGLPGRTQNFIVKVTNYDEYAFLLYIDQLRNFESNIDQLRNFESNIDQLRNFESNIDQLRNFGLNIDQEKSFTLER